MIFRNLYLFSRRLANALTVPPCVIAPLLGSGHSDSSLSCLDSAVVHVRANNWTIHGRDIKDIINNMRKEVASSRVSDFEADRRGFSLCSENRRQCVAQKQLARTHPFALNPVSLVQT